MNNANHEDRAAEMAAQAAAAAAAAAPETAALVIKAGTTMVDRRPTAETFYRSRHRVDVRPLVAAAAAAAAARRYEEQRP